MTVSSTAVSKSYKPGSAMAPEAIGFQFLDPSDIEVVHVAAATGVRTTLVPGTDYIIAGDAMGDAATITATAVWPADDDFVVTRRTAMLQSTSLVPQEPLKAKALERQLDRLALVDQEHDGRIGAVEDSAIFAAPNEPGFALPAKVARAGRLAAFSDLLSGATLIPIELTAADLAALAGQDVAIGVLASNINVLLAVDADLANVNAVAGGLVNVNAVAAALANINTLAGAIANVNIVAGGIANINTVAANIATVSAVGGSIANVNAVANDMALGAGASYILRAPQAAIDAATARDAAIAAVAAVPIGSSVIVLDQPPASNLGKTGDRLLDLKNGLMWLSKEATGWLTSIAVTIASPMVGQTAFAQGIASTPVVQRVEFRKGAIFPTDDWTFTRASSSTDLLYTDPYTYLPTTFANNQPVMRADGTGRWQLSKQFLLNTEAPVSQTTTQSLAVGKCAALCWGPPGTQIDVQPGTAVGTGWGTLAGDALNYREITITTAGTVTVTVTGALTRFNLQQNPTLPSITKPAPYIQTAGAAVTRSPDFFAATAQMLTFLNGTAAGRMLVIGTDKVVPSYGNAPSLLGLNGVVALYAALSVGLPALTIYDVVNHTNVASAGTSSWQSLMRAAIAYDNTATVTYGAGTRVESQFGFSFNNGGAVTAAQLGGPATSAYGDGALCGLIPYYEKVYSRPADTSMYDTFTQLAPVKATDLAKDFNPATDLRQTKRAYDRLQAGAIDCLIAAVFGDSHIQGVNPSANGVNTSIVAYIAERLNAKSYVTTIDSFAGSMGNNFAGGGAAHLPNPRIASSAALNSGNGGIGGWGPGGEWLRLVAGENLTFTPTLNNSKCTILYAIDPTYGTFSFQVDDGAGGWTTVSTINAVGAQAMALASITGPLGARKWRMLGATGTCWISAGWAYDPLTKPIVLLNCGRTGARAANLAQIGGAGISNAQLAQRTLAASLYITSLGDTNDASDGTALASVEASMDAVVSNMATVGDVVVVVEPATKTSSLGQVVQTVYKRLARACARKNRVPIADLNAAQGGAYDPYGASGFYLSDALHYGPRGNRRAGYAVADNIIIPALSEV